MLPDGTNPTNREAGWALAVVMAGGLLLRLAYAAWGYFSTFDTATVGWMGLNILQHGERPLFFYGQTYFGSLEAYLAALLFSLFGISEFVLSLSAILCSLGWIGAAYLLFTEWADRRAGLAAAALLAVPSWVLLHYNVGTYGGYPLAFGLGTLALWLCLRILRREPAGVPLLAHAAPLGLIGGLALWTHYLAAAYLLPGALLLLAFLVRRKFSWSAVWPFLVAGIPFLAGLWPVLAASDLLQGTQAVAQWNFSPAVLRAHTVSLFGRPLRQPLFNQWESPALRVMVLAGFAGTGILYVASLWRARREDAWFRWLAPLGFAALFLALYLPHAMAQLEAARYTIPLWTILFPGLVVLPLVSSSRALRGWGGGALAAWLAYYAVSDVLGIVNRRPKQQQELVIRERVVTAARAARLRHVMVIGSEVDGHHGQIFSFTARGDIAFVSALDERHQPSAVAAEQDDRCGLLVRRGGEDNLTAALRDLGATWRTIPCEEFSLLCDIRVTPLSGRVIRLSPAALSDRRADTGVSGDYGADNVLQLEWSEPRILEAVALLPLSRDAARLPRRFRILGSSDGVQFRELSPGSDRIALAWTAGRRAWVKGYDGYLECRFPPTLVRTLRLEMLGGARDSEPGWSLAEVYAYEAAPPAPVPENEPENIFIRALEQKLDFVAADRWLSGQLGALASARHETLRVFSRYNPKFPDTWISPRLRPRPGLGIAVALALADDTEAVLREALPGAQWTRTNFAAYALFSFVPAAGPGELEWASSFLLRAPP